MKTAKREKRADLQKSVLIPCFSACCRPLKRVTDKQQNYCLNTLFFSFQGKTANDYKRQTYMIICALRLSAKNYLFCIYFRNYHYIGQQRGVAECIKDAGAFFYAYDPTLCQSTGPQYNGGYAGSCETNFQIEKKKVAFHRD